MGHCAHSLILAITRLKRLANMIPKTFIYVWLLFSAAIFSACGGGGGGTATPTPVTPTPVTPTPVTPTPVTPTPSATFTISGSTTYSNGTALAGVQLGLSGTNASYTISNANGFYTFTGLPNGGRDDFFADE